MRKGSVAPYDYRKYLDEQLDKRVPSREAASVRRTKVALPRSKEYGTGNVELTLPYRSVVSCARLTTSPCHLFRSAAALFSW